MKKYLLLTILIPIIGSAQNVDFGAMTTQAIQTHYQRTTEQAAVKENRRIEDERQKSAFSKEQSEYYEKQRMYLEQQRLQELENKKLEEQKNKEEENDPNSILNKFKTAKLKQENEDLKNKLILMELQLAEKDKLEKEKVSKQKSKKLPKKNK